MESEMKRNRKKRSMHRLISMLMLYVILLTSLGITSVSIAEMRDHAWERSREMLYDLSVNGSSKMNGLLNNMEKSVEIMEIYVRNSKADLSDPRIRTELLENAQTMFLSIAQHTDKCETFYLRLAPERSDPFAGFFFGMNAEESGFESQPLVDLFAYDRDDTEHVGWYWEPVGKGSSLWMDPYFNQNYGISMISYCMPIYDESGLMGVVGMDFDITTLTDHLEEARLYEHGYAYLADEAGIVYHPQLKPGAPEPDISRSHLTERVQLKNGMQLVLAASNADVRAIYFKIARDMLTIVAVLVVAILLVTNVGIRKHVKMIKKLTDASVRLSNGDYDVEFGESSVKEIARMYSAFQKMSRQLQERDSYQQKMAYTDGLTGLRNANAFKYWVSYTGTELINSGSDFGLIVLDINGLKETNDTRGHVMGDRLIAASAKLIADIFKRSPVYRVGGDEFVVVLQNRDLENYENLLRELRIKCEKEHADADCGMDIGIAMGVAFHRKGLDTSVEDVLKRADAAMYNDKHQMKGE